MKITRILPRKLAKAYQEEDLRRKKTHLEYHRQMVNGFEVLVEEARIELDRLRRDENV